MVSSRPRIVPQRQPDHDREDVEPVGHRVEDLAQHRLLVELAREPAVEVVGEAGDHQQRQRPRVLLGAQHEPEEERDAEQPQEAQGVRKGPHERLRPIGLRSRFA